MHYLDVVQAFIDKFRYNAKRASLVQSRIKALERLAEVEVTEKDPEYVFTFPDTGAAIPAPIVGFHDVDFNYPGGKTLFKGLNFGLVRHHTVQSLQPRIALFFCCSCLCAALVFFLMQWDMINS